MAKGESNKIGSEWRTSNLVSQFVLGNKGRELEESYAKEARHGSLRENTARERRKYSTIARDNNALWEANSQPSLKSTHPFTTDDPIMKERGDKCRQYISVDGSITRSRLSNVPPSISIESDRSIGQCFFSTPIGRREYCTWQKKIRLSPQ
jgi:hypothetical protein